MKTLFLVLGLLITSQVGNLGDRYQVEATALPAEFDVAAVEESSLADSPGTNPALDPVQDSTPLTPAAPAQPATRSGEKSATESPKTNDYFDIDNLGATPPSTISQQSAAVEPRLKEQPAESPTTLIEGFGKAPVSDKLVGTPLSLASVLTGAATRAEQSERVEAYWELSRAILEYNLAVREKTELAALRQGIGAPTIAWDAALKSTEADFRLAQAAVRGAQARLVGLLHSAATPLSPLPSDLPFCGVYETRYKEIFRNQQSAAAASLDEILSLTFAEINQRSTEIGRARQWMFAVSERRNPQSDGSDLLMAYQLFAAQRRSFVRAIADYNLQIVRYSELASPGIVEPERLLTMLIRTEPSTSTTIDNNLQRASAEQAEGNATNPPTSNRTPWNSQPETGERSILVPKN